MHKLVDIPSAEDLALAAKAIAPYVHRTPLLSSNSISKLLGVQLFFKCENFQKVGAFKMRGAACAVASLTDEERSQGIATHSSGNHAQAVALTAKLYNIPAHIVMPKNAPNIKRKAVEGYGAKVYTCASTIEAREEKMGEVLEQTGATFIHPYNNYNIIAGQATAALETLADQPDLDIIMAPVGGGGLMSGTALACAYHTGGQVIAIGAEPSLVDDAYRSLASGKVESNERIDTIADGLRTKLGEFTLKVLRSHLDQIVLVTEETIVQAMRLVWERMKLVVEPSAAVPLAAIMTKPELFQGKKVAIIFSGGNVDLEHLPF